MANYVRCAVRTCSNNSRKTGNRIRYFRFPRDSDLLTLWTVRCDRLDTWTPSSSFICSSHFTADDYVEVTPGISRLHPEAVPSRHLGYDWDSEDRGDDTHLSNPKNNEIYKSKNVLGRTAEGGLLRDSNPRCFSTQDSDDENFRQQNSVTEFRGGGGGNYSSRRRESNDHHDVMTMEDNNFTSEDDDTNDSIVRALMSMSDGSRLPNVTNPEINYPLTGSSSLGSTLPTTSATVTFRTQSDSVQFVPKRSSAERKHKDPNVIVVTDVRKKIKKVKQVDPNTVPAMTRQREKFCVVPTCSAKKGDNKDTKTGFHYLPKNPNDRLKWIRAIFYSDIYCKRSRFLCRRHFTTDDYLEPPRSGIPARLRKGAVPNQNIPICEAECLLARKKLWLDLNRRKPEEKNLTFVERLSREPELQELLKRYVEEASKIDPNRAAVVPVIPRRGELVGPGEPVPGTGIIPVKKKKRRTFEDFSEEEKAEFLANKKKKLERKKENQRLRDLQRSNIRKQLSEERKMELFEEKLVRLELLKNNPEAYHQLMVEEQETQMQEKLALKFMSRQKVDEIDQERLQLKFRDPEAYNELLAKERAEKRKKKLAERITEAAHTKNPVNFSDKIEIIAEDPEKGGKYKVVVKRVLKRKNDGKPNSIRHLVNNKTKSREIVQNVIREIDFSKAKRVKFAEADKLTKISNLRSMGIGVEGLIHNKPPERKDAATCTTEGPAVVVEPVIVGDDFEADHLPSLAEHHHSDDDHFGDDHHSDEDPFKDDPNNENNLEDMTDGYDHSYTNKTSQLNEDPLPKDPIDELRDRLRSLPESEARALVKEKMDTYKETFKKQMTRMRAVLQAKKKVDRKVKMLTRTLCVSLREQYVKYYKN